jgi:ribosomal protein S27E
VRLKLNSNGRQNLSSNSYGYYYQKVHEPEFNEIIGSLNNFYGLEYKEPIQEESNFSQLQRCPKCDHIDTVYHYEAGVTSIKCLGCKELTKVRMPFKYEFG